MSVKLGVKSCSAVIVQQENRRPPLHHPTTSAGRNDLPRAMVGCGQLFSLRSACPCVLEVRPLLLPFCAIRAQSAGNHHLACVEGMLTFCRKRQAGCTSSADLPLGNDQETGSLGKLPAMVRGRLLLAENIRLAVR